MSAMLPRARARGGSLRPLRPRPEIRQEACPRIQAHHALLGAWLVRDAPEAVLRRRIWRTGLERADGSPLQCGGVFVWPVAVFRAADGVPVGHLRPPRPGARQARPRQTNAYLACLLRTLCPHRDRSA